MFTVVFVSPNGQTVAEFTRQTRHQVQLLFGRPPDCAVVCRTEMRVRAA